MSDLCCENLRAALQDREPVVEINQTLGTCLKKGEDIIPIGFCPWCGRERPKTLATTPAMLYRP